MGESLKINELRLVIQSLLEILGKKRDAWNDINHQNLTLIIKTNIRYLNDINLNDIKKDCPSITIDKLEFDLQNPIYTLQMFQDSDWEQKDLQKKIENELQESPFYHQVTLSNCDISSPLATALYVNTFGQPKVIKSLYQMEAVKSDEHWKNIFSIWRNACNNHGITLENFLAFLWMVATLRKNNDTTDPYNILANIATIQVGNKNTSQKPWFEWDPGLYQLLKEIWGEETVSNFDFVGDKPNQLVEFEWAAFLMKMLEADNSFTDPVNLTTVFKNIKHLLPHFIQVLGTLPNNKSWTHYKNIIANNLIEACIIINRFEEREHVMRMLMEFFEDEESFAGANYKRIQELSKTLKEMRKQRKKDFDFRFYMEEHWFEWSALERNDFLDAYLSSKNNDSDYLKALMDILPLLLAFTNVTDTISFGEDKYLTTRTKYIDLIFDCRENGQLRRVFQITADKLLVEDKIRKFIEMKVLEIIFNNGLEMWKTESYMGDVWKDIPYNSASLDENEKIWSQFIENIKIHKQFICYDLSNEERQNRYEEINKLLVDSLTDNGIISKSTLFIDMKRLVIAQFIQKYLVQAGYFDKSFEILKSSNILLTNDCFSNCIRTIIIIEDQLHQIFYNKESKQLPELDISEYNLQESFVFLILLCYYFLDDSTVTEERNKLQVEKIVHEGINCFIKNKEIKNNIKLHLLNILNQIFAFSTIDIQVNTISPTTVSEILKSGLEYILNKLKTLITEHSIWLMLNILKTSKKLQTGKKHDDLSNKVYLMLSRIMIIKPDFFAYLMQSDKEYLDTLQTEEWCKQLATSLGELVYQQIAWIFNNHSSFSEEELIGFRGEMDDLEFFESSMEEFAKHKLPQDVNHMEEIAFLCCVIATIIRDLLDTHNPDADKYCGIFKDFLVKIDNLQKCSLINFLVEYDQHNMFNGEDFKQYHECIEYLLVLLDMISI